MPDSEMSATELQANRTKWRRYLADYMATCDAITRAEAKVAGAIAGTTNGAQLATLASQRAGLAIQQSLVDEKENAAVQGMGRISPPTKEEVEAHQAAAAAVANRTANNMGATAAVKTATQLAQAFAGLHKP
jgi:hypothetical protein